MFEDLFGDDDGSSFVVSGSSGYQGKKKKHVNPPRQDSRFVGLDNQGATCYLNSLIQTMYLTPELRAGLFRLSPEDLGLQIEEPTSNFEPTEQAGSSSNAAKSAVIAAAPTPMDANAGDNVAGLTMDVLLSMGFSKDLCMRAVRRFGNINDYEKVLQWMFAEQEKQQQQSVSEKSPAATSDFNSPQNEAPMEIVSLFDALDGSNSNLDSNVGGDGLISDYFGAAPQGRARDEEDDIGAINESLRAGLVAEWAFSDCASFPTEEDLNPTSSSTSTFSLGDVKMVESGSAAQESIYGWQSDKDKSLPSPSHARVVTHSAVGGSGSESQQREVQPPTATASTTSNEEEKKSSVASEKAPATNVTESAQPAASQAPKPKPKKIPIQLQKLFANLQLMDSRSTSTHDLTESFGWHGREASVQHDVQELNRVLFDALDQSLKGTPESDLISRLYKGTIVNRTVCSQCGNVSRREEDFLDISLVVKNMKHITHSLSQYVAEESFEGDNQYFCEPCQKKVDAKRNACIQSLPPIMIFSLLRFDYDWVNDRRTKLTAEIEFPETLDLAPFTEQGLQEIKEAEKNGALDGFELAPIDYELFSVIIHSGSAYGGHYHAYIRDTLKEGVWKKLSEEETAAMVSKKGNNNKGSSKKKSKLNFEESEENGEGSSSSLQDAWKDKKTGKGKSKDKPAAVVEVFVAEPTSTTDAKESDTETQPPAEEKADQSSAPKEEEPEEDGSWFNFDDSRVTPIPTSLIKTQFGGKSECAYMLVYRAKSLPITQPPTPPTHLVSSLQRANTELAKERESADADNHSVQFTIYAPQDMKVYEGAILGPKDSNSSKKVLHGDDRVSLNELRNSIVEKFAPGPTADNLTIYTLQRQGGERMSLGTALGRSADGEATLHSLHLVNNMCLLVGGQENIIQSLTGDVMNLQILWYTEVTNPSTFELMLPSTATMGDLKQAIFERTSIPLHLQFYSKVDSRGPTSLTDIRQDPSSKDNEPLFVLGVSDGSKLAVETYSEENHAGAVLYRSLAMQDHQLAENCFEIIVIDMLSPLSSVQTYPPRPSNKPNEVHVSAPKHYSIADLKDLVVSKIPGSEVSKDAVCLRQTLLNDSPGTVFENELRLLSQIGVTTGSRLIIEFVEGGQMQGHVKMFDIKIIEIAGGVKTGKEYKIAVSRQMTIAQCKEQVSALCGKPSSDFRFRTADVWEAPDRLITDEHKTIENENIREDEIVFMEQGKAPLKGQISLPIHRCDLWPPKLSSPNVEGTGEEQKEKESEMKTEEEKKEGESKTTVETSTSTETGGDFEMDLFSFLGGSSDSFSSTPSGPREEPLTTYIGTLDIAQTCTLLELKMRLLELPSFSDVPSPLHLRVRDLVDGKRPGKVYRQDDKSLQKQHIQDGRLLVVQVLSEPETLPDLNGIMLTVRRRECYTQTFGPGIEVFFTKSDIANVKSFRNKVLEVFKSGKLPGKSLEDFEKPANGGETKESHESTTTGAYSLDERLIVTKFLTQTKRWKVIETPKAAASNSETQPQPSPGGKYFSSTLPTESKFAALSIATEEGSEAVLLDATSETASEKAQPASSEQSAKKGVKFAPSASVNASKAPAETELRGKPYYLKDGDIIVVKDPKDDPHNEDEFFDSEDITETTSTRSWTSSDGKSTRKVARPIEVSLKIEI